MSIEKKSLISNRIASKKAIVTKPEAKKVASTRATLPKISTSSFNKITPARVAAPKVTVSKG